MPFWSKKKKDEKKKDGGLTGEPGKIPQTVMQQAAALGAAKQEQKDKQPLPGEETKDEEAAGSPVDAATQKDKEDLETNKNSDLKKLVEHVTQEGFMDPPPPPPPKTKVDKGKALGKKVLGNVEKTFDPVTKVAQKISGNEEIPEKVGGVISGAFSTIKECVELVMQIRLAFKTKSKYEIGKAVQDSVMTIKNACDNTLGVVNNFTGIIDRIPIIGPILSAIGCFIEFATHVGQLVHAGRGLHEMKKLKKEEKSELMEEYEGGEGGFVEQKKDKWYKKAKPGQMHVNKDKAGRRRNQLKKELEELNKSRPLTEEQAKEEAAKKRELESLNEYFLTGEIKSADRKRVKQGALDITADVVNLLATVASLEPTIGAAIGTGLKASVSVGKGLQKGGGMLRQVIRNHQGKKDPENFIGKSTAAKTNRRSELGNFMVDKIADLKELNIDQVNADTDPVGTVRGVNRQYNTIRQQIHGMGVYYSVLMRTKNREDMVGRFAAGMSREGDKDSDIGFVTGFMY